MKHQRSSRDPPPRATRTTSTRPWTAARAARRLAGASGPWTRDGATTTSARGKRRRRTTRTSWITAPASEVTTPIRRGNAGRGRFLDSSKRPSAARRRRVVWKAAQNAPTPAGVRALTTSWTSPRRAYRSTSPDATTSIPSSRSKPRPSDASRNRTHAICAFASFRPKKTCPAGVRWTLPASPRTRTRPSKGFDRRVSRRIRVSSVTVRARGPSSARASRTAIASMVRSRADHAVCLFQGRMEGWTKVNPRQRGSDRGLLPGHARVGLRMR